jgi:hypothetical protein
MCFGGAQVVPTQYKTLYGELSYLNQYSVIEKDVPYETVQRVEPIPGLRLREFQGVVFTYDFHPVRMSLLLLFVLCTLVCFLNGPFAGACASRGAVSM